MLAQKLTPAPKSQDNHHPTIISTTIIPPTPTTPFSYTPSSSSPHMSTATAPSFTNSNNEPLQLHDTEQPGAPRRRSSVSSNHTGTTKTMNRTRKPPTISTQQLNSSGSGGKDNSATATPAPRSSSVRRKSVAFPVPTTPSSSNHASYNSPLIQSPEAAAKPQRDGSSSYHRSNYEQDVNFRLDRTIDLHVNGSQGNGYFSPHSNQSRSNNDKINGGGSSLNITCSGIEGPKRRTSIIRPGGFLKSSGGRGPAGGGGRGVINSNTSPSAMTVTMTSSLLSTGGDNNTGNTGGTMSSHSTSNSDNGNGGSSTTHQDGQSHHPNQQQQSKGGNIGQKFGDLLSFGGSILGSKKRGSDTSIRPGWTSPATSPSTIFSLVTKDGFGTSFGKKEVFTSPSTPSSLLSKNFGSQQQQQSYPDSAGINSLGDFDSTLRGSEPWNATDDSKIVNWEMNKSVPSSEYENEAFALWIRPNIQARTVISGADVEDAEKAALNDNATSRDEERRKKYRLELEDMKVLEEVLDFAIIILMRASASLYPFIASAHSKSIPINIHWKTLQYEDRSWRRYTVRTLKEYQDYVMADIGCAIQAMIEIYDQQERPYSHPDNMGRDTKPQVGGGGGARTCPVVLPQNRPRLNRKNISSMSINIGTSMRPIPTNLAYPLFGASTSTLSSISMKHRRHSSIPGGRPTISSMITSIKQSLPSPMSLHSPQQSRTSADSYNHPFYSSYPDGTPFSSAIPGRSAPLSYTQAESIDQHHVPYSYSGSGGSSGGSSGSGGGGGGFLPQSIQSMINSIRGNSANSAAPSLYSSNIALNSPGTPPVALSKQEERRQQMEHRWRIDIMRRKAHLRAWACQCFLDLYHYSLMTKTASLEDEFKDLYRIINAIVDVDANANEKSHDVLVSIMAQARELEREPFKLRYSKYKTKAPTGKEIREANSEAVRRFETEYMQQRKPKWEVGSLNRKLSTDSKDDGASMKLRMDDCVAPLRQLASRSSDTSQDSVDGGYGNVDDDDGSIYSQSPSSSAYDCMEFYGLQPHPVWEPLLDRLNKFDTTHHELDARNIFQFLRRMSLYSAPVADTRHLLSDETRDEMLAVLWVIEKCVRERPDYQQSPTWFRLSSSSIAVQAVYNAGGVIPYLKELKQKDPKGRDPISTVHPVTLTGYFKRLLKESGGLLLKETTGLFVELARPATDNGDFWNLEKLSRIDRALLYRVICLDLNRGHVFLRISRVMDQILESSPKDMELDAFALSKMVQVVELSGVLDLKALRRWNGAWSAIILGYM